jgi:hypothetical protein
MSDLGDVAARLAELSDADIAAAVARATANRPALSSLRAAAEGFSSPRPAPEPTESVPEVPAQPNIPSSADVPPPIAFSVADAARRVRDKREGPRHEDLEAIRESLRRTIRPER